MYAKSTNVPLRKLFAFSGMWLALLASSGSIRAQTPLPADMKADFHDTLAAILRPSVSAIEDPIAKITFDTEGRHIDLQWTFGIAGTETGLGTMENGWRFDELSVGYEPTALCAEAGVSSRFYVAGWVQRLNTTMIEQFDVTNMAVATTGQATVLSLTYERSIVLVRTDIGPVRALSYHHTQDRLWILEDASTARLLSLDVDSGGSVIEIANASEVPELSQMHSGLEVFVESTSPTGGGFYVILRPQYAWDFIENEDVDPLSVTFVCRDEDLDGVLDESAVKTWEQVLNEVDFDNADWWYD